MSSRTSFLRVASKMPALKHGPKEGEKYDVMKSEVTEWLVAQPETREFLMSHVMNFDAIAYDKETGLWSGSGQDFDEPYTFEEIKNALGGRELRALDLLPRCAKATGRLMTQRGFTMRLKRLVDDGALEFDPGPRTYRELRPATT